MSLILPTEQGASSYTMRATLDGVSFGVELNWNGRVGAWYLSLYDAAGVALLRSRKVVTNFPLLSRFRFIDGLPAGELIAVDPSETIAYANYTELGERLGVTLLYIEASEIG